MIDKEPGIKRNRNPLKRLAKLTIPVIATGLALSDNSTARVDKISPTLASDTPVPAVNLAPLENIENQVVPINEEKITALKQSTADKFGLEIQTFDDISRYPTMQVLYGLENLLPTNHEWNEDNLELLTDTLEFVPNDFYKPRNGEKVHVILGPTSHCGYDIKGFTPKYPYEVMLSYSLFKPEKPLTAALVLTHEFGHLKTTESCNSPLGPNYVDRLEELTGQNFEQLQKELPAQIEEKANELGVKVRKGGVFSSVDSLTPEGEESFRLTRLNYGTKNEKEFMGVLFESYFMGEEYFGRMYRPFFESKSDGLYDFIKEIYQGKEFPDYHITASELKK